MMRFSHVGIVVEDMEKSIDFYVKVLGCEVSCHKRSENPEFALLKADQQTIELLKFKEDKKERKEGVISHLAFSVEDMKKAIERIKALGVVLEQEEPRVLDSGMKIFFFTGPSGESLEFVQSCKG